jgi:hypothetical protein
MACRRPRAGDLAQRGVLEVPGLDLAAEPEAGLVEAERERSGGRRLGGAGGGGGDEAEQGQEKESDSHDRSNAGRAAAKLDRRSEKAGP